MVHRPQPPPSPFSVPKKFGGAPRKKWRGRKGERANPGSPETGWAQKRRPPGNDRGRPGVSQKTGGPKPASRGGGGVHVSPRSLGQGASWPPTMRRAPGRFGFWGVTSLPPTDHPRLGGRGVPRGFPSGPRGKKALVDGAALPFFPRPFGPNIRAPGGGLNPSRGSGWGKERVAKVISTRENPGNSQPQGVNFVFGRPISQRPWGGPPLRKIGGGPNPPPERWGPGPPLAQGGKKGAPRAGGGLAPQTPGWGERFRPRPQEAGCPTSRGPGKIDWAAAPNPGWWLGPEIGKPSGPKPPKARIKPGYGAPGEGKTAVPRRAKGARPKRRRHPQAFPREGGATRGGIHRGPHPEVGATWWPGNQKLSRLPRP